jgi:hypothetical protein
MNEHTSTQDVPEPSPGPTDPGEPYPVPDPGEPYPAPDPRRGEGTFASAA